MKKAAQKTAATATPKASTPELTIDDIEIVLEYYNEDVRAGIGYAGMHLVEFNQEKDGRFCVEPISEADSAAWVEKMHFTIDRLGLICQTGSDGFTRWMRGMHTELA